MLAKRWFFIEILPQGARRFDLTFGIESIRLMICHPGISPDSEIHNVRMIVVILSRSRS